MDSRLLVEHVRHRAPFAPGEAERAIAASLQGLVATLGPTSLRELSREFGFEPPTPLAADEGERALARRIAESEHVDDARALEYLHIVCGGLARQPDSTAVGKLRRELPDALLGLLELPDEGEGRTPQPALHGRTLADGRPGSHRSLSGGRPGSDRPLSEAAPHAAQQHSVAADDNPHADTKLSSAGGLTQEREKESLAQGKSKVPTP